MNATERFRKLLDERGVEWMGTIYTKPTQGHPTNTSLDEEHHDAVFIEYVDGSVLRMFDLSPEQAVEAMLGRGTCKVVSKPCDMWECECGKAWWHGGAPNYCPSCGREVVVS